MGRAIFSQKMYAQDEEDVKRYDLIFTGIVLGQLF